MNKARKNNSPLLVVKSKDNGTDVGIKPPGKVVNLDDSKAEKKKADPVSEKLIFSWLNPFV